MDNIIDDLTFCHVLLKDINKAIEIQEKLAFEDKYKYYRCKGTQYEKEIYGDTIKLGYIENTQTKTGIFRNITTLRNKLLEMSKKIQENR